MTPNESHDAGTESVVQLTTLTPDLERAERVRLRCRAQLGRRQQRAARSAAIASFAWHVLAPVVVGGFCVLYVMLVVVTTLHLEGVFD
jgi:hypothetical protein